MTTKISAGAVADNVPVEVVNAEPLQVEVAAPVAPEPIVTQAGNLSMPPTTTEQEDVVTARQSRINLIWEFTQAIIAIMITGAIIYVEVAGLETHHISNAFFFIVATYFTRTNHVKIGGIGQKPNEQPYRGR